MYEPSRTYENFFIAGFQHWDGATVLRELKPGTPLALRAEPDNPADAQAVALYCGDAKLGYVPAEKNAAISQLLFFGHADVFETLVLSVDPDEQPWKQVYAGVRVKDAR